MRPDVFKRKADAQSSGSGSDQARGSNGGAKGADSSSSSSGSSGGGAVDGHGGKAAAKQSKLEKQQAETIEQQVKWPISQ